MRIGSSASAWTPEKETGIVHALATLTFHATTKAEAEFLTRLHCCFRRGNPDPRLLEIVHQIHERESH